MTQQLRYQHKPARTNWGSMDDQHIIHVKYFVDGVRVPFKELYEGKGKEMNAWCKQNLGKPFGRGDGQSLTGVWKPSTNFDYFVFKHSTDAMLFKMAWAS